MILKSARLRLAGTVILLFMSFAFTSGLHAQSAFCTDAGCTREKVELKRICDFIVANRASYPTIYIGGYYMRTLVAGSQIFGDKKYLDTAVAYGDYLLAHQMENGFWQTGYGPVYMADTGSAIALFIVLYNHVDHDRQQKYFDATQKYINSIQREHMINPDGSFGTGWRKVVDGKLDTPLFDEYTLSSALTGAQIFTWMYDRTHKDEYREISYHALKWVFSTMNSEGRIPHILAEEGFVWEKRDDPAMQKKLFESQVYGTSGYVGEGVIAFDLHCQKKSWQKWIEGAVKPNIEFLLRTQLANGTWSEMPQTSWDRTRSIGIIDYMIWYYDHVKKDQRILDAVHKWDNYVLSDTNDHENGKAYGLVYDGNEGTGRGQVSAFNTASSLTGRALADMITPGIDAEW